MKDGCTSPKKGYRLVKGLFGKEIEIPEEWDIFIFNQIFKNKQSNKNKVKESHYLEKGKYPIIDQGKSLIAGYTNNSSLLYENLPVIIFGDHTLVVKFIDFKFVIGADGTKIIHVDDRYFLKFIYYSIINKNLKSEGYKRHFSKLKRQLFLIPLLLEQIKIASILSRVDALIECTQEVVNKAELLKKGLMQELLTRGIGHKKFKRVRGLFGKEIEIPEEWEIRKLDGIGELIGGGTPDSTNLEYWNGEILWAVPTDITKLQTNLIENTERKITKKGLDNSSAKLLPIGTVLITSRATIGKCAITTKSITTNQGFQNIICNKDQSNLFIFYVMKHNQNVLVRLSYGTTFLEISKKDMRKMLVCLPYSSYEQQKIASILSGVDAINNLFLLTKIRIRLAIFLTLLRLSTLRVQPYKKKTYTVVITKDLEDGGFVGRCDELHAVSEGDTFGDMMENIKEAVELAAEESGNLTEFNMLIIKQ